MYVQEKMFHKGCVAQATYEQQKSSLQADWSTQALAMANFPASLAANKANLA